MHSILLQYCCQKLFIKIWVLISHIYIDAISVCNFTIIIDNSSPWWVLNIFSSINFSIHLTIKLLPNFFYKKLFYFRWYGGISSWWDKMVWYLPFKLSVKEDGLTAETSFHHLPYIPSKFLNVKIPIIV